MCSLYALHLSLSVAISAIQPRLRLSGTNRLRSAFHGGQRGYEHIRKKQNPLASANQIVFFHIALHDHMS
ncbi:MAG: hypothetical protein KZQ66_14820 [Candidatus Thiodiazotropha sp. (ex Lucinoma aequizonata)]|nr:hypothetical protein [Candidatus Thiodiazotropha sp. (ex Lucinoma aequizonata)]MCU7896926.1 hypothetical protein [Candidatus Thiodiazotropha sp. (ex Lucinoma aequizonata)]MCU7903110.1 hypothetical protein [Candidatus Thiodiazotropha sp. (ex Lucinoma aequizonata)]MCU7907246.1 hypothetical protein [Candidatus Thiodiazotropha sp. (ex Lucinoma aequizonata)]MCU7912300.1 hypothetical protein [Candidatus Thiodiazotropha sp. (ex Lucinoma aequizonata)]